MLAPGRYLVHDGDVTEEGVHGTICPGRTALVVKLYFRTFVNAS